MFVALIQHVPKVFLWFPQLNPPFSGWFRCCQQQTSKVITYTLLVGSFPFAGRDGDTAMLQRIGAGKYRGQWDGCSWTVSMGNHLWDVVKSPFSMVFHGILGGFEWNTIHGFEELFLTGPYNFHGYVNGWKPTVELRQWFKYEWHRKWRWRPCLGHLSGWYGTVSYSFWNPMCI